MYSFEICISVLTCDTSLLVFLLFYFNPIESGCQESIRVRSWNVEFDEITIEKRISGALVTEAFKKKNEIIYFMLSQVSNTRHGNPPGTN